MNKVISKTISVLLSLGLSLSANTSVIGQTSTNLCSSGGISFGFFNGVQTDIAEAEIERQLLKQVYGVTSPSGEAIQYELFYNDTSGLSDFVETFDQRLKEQNGLLAGRFELFFQAIQGGGSWWSRITATVDSTSSILSAISDLYRSAAAANLASVAGQFLTTPPTSLTYQEHRVRIDNSALSGKKMLFFAHSQGNLFANVAYDYALTKVSASNVKLVHVAPASPSLRGGYTLADLDLVINGLRLVGNVPPITDFMPGIALRQPGLNGYKDPLGHGLLEIYMNPQHTTAQRIKGQVNDALAGLVAPPTLATDGFFNATLTWDGPGDVDLHTYEPGGAHVYYSSRRGASGFLDVDNTAANGPEHYYASCNASELQTGTYSFAVANYRGANGRTAVVQISSRASGVLGTRSVLLGGSTGNTPSSTLFSVVVSREASTGAFSVGLAP